MTTIAIKDGTLAADTQLTWGSIRGFSHKIFVTPAGVYAISGSVSEEARVHKYILDGELPVKTKGNYEVILIRDKKILVCANSLHFYPLENPFFAIGNGWQVAMAAMSMGKTAEESVKEAAKLNIYTNDLVDTYNIKTKKLTLAPFPK